MSEAEKELPAEDQEANIPDDFFEDFENNDFLEGLVENVHNANASEAEHSDYHEQEESSAEDGRSSSPIVEQCLREIDKLTQDIRRRKRRLEKELSSKDQATRDDESEAPTSSTDIDNPSSSRRRPRRSRSPRSSKERHRPVSRTRTIHRTIRRSRSRSRERRRTYQPTVRRSRSRERRPARRSRSPVSRTKSPPRKRNRSAGSPSATAHSHSSKSNISFLEELEQTFAKQGKDFPEKDFLLHSKSQGNSINNHQNNHLNNPQNNHQSNHPNNHHPANWVQPQLQMGKVPLLQSPIPPMYPGPQNNQGYYNDYPSYSNNMSHMNPELMHHMNPNPMNPNIMHMQQSFGSYHTRYAIQQSHMEPRAPPLPPPADTPPAPRAPPPPLSPVLIPIAQMPIPMDISPTIAPQVNSYGPPSNSSRINALKRCKLAIKIISADENKLPKTQFLANRISVNGRVEGQTVDATPLKCIKNVSFRFHSRSQETSSTTSTSSSGPTLGTRSKAVVRVLGFSCDQLVEALRMKTMANRVITKIQEKLPASAKSAQTRNIYVQTTPMECDKCVAHENRVLINQSVQTEGPKMVSIKIQTNKETYTEPLMNTLKSMSSAQLVAMTDFAHILCDQPPSNSAEIFKLREQMMDVYNLSKRDDEAVRTAERDRLNSVRDLLSNSRRQERSVDPRLRGANNSLDEFEFHRGFHEMDDAPMHNSMMPDSMIHEAEIELQRVEQAERNNRMRAEAMDGNNFDNDMRGGRPGRFQRGGPRGMFPWRGRGGGNRGFNPNVWHQ